MCLAAEKTPTALMASVCKRRLKLSDLWYVLRCVTYGAGECGHFMWRERSGKQGQKTSASDVLMETIRQLWCVHPGTSRRNNTTERGIEGQQPLYTCLIGVYYN